MKWRVLWSERSKEDLRSLGSSERTRVVKKVESHLVKDPAALGKPLSGNLGGLYRYRIGDYRVIYQLRKEDVLVVVLRLGHRKEVYEN